MFGVRLANVIQLAREAAPELLIFYHSDGDFTPLILDLVLIGVDLTADHLDVVLGTGPSIGWRACGGRG